MEGKRQYSKPTFLVNKLEQYRPELSQEDDQEGCVLGFDVLRAMSGGEGGDK